MRKSFHKNVSKIEKEAKRKKRNMFLMSSFLVAILVVSLFGYAFFYSPQANTQSVEEYGHTFFVRSVSGQQVWASKFGENEQYFYRLPSEVEGFYTDSQSLAAINESQGLLITYDPLGMDSQVAQAVLSQYANLNDVKVVVFGQTVNASTFNLPIITCADATPQAPVVLVGLTNSSNQTGILFEDNCILVQALTPSDLLLTTDKFRYATFGIEYES